MVTDFRSGIVQHDYMGLPAGTFCAFIIVERAIPHDRAVVGIIEVNLETNFAFAPHLKQAYAAKKSTKVRLPRRVCAHHTEHNNNGNP